MKKTNLTNLLLILVLIAGIGLLLYPTVSDYLNSLNQTRAINSYVDSVAQMDETENDSILEKARDFNDRLLKRHDDFWLTEELQEEYETLLNINGDGIMCYVEIPSLNILLPVYHGTSNAVLDHGLGHMEFSSLPVGGTGYHSIISGHRGLPSARLFTDLDKMAVGDQFFVHVLNQELIYEVDQILIVLPEETGGLLSIPDKDCCTLVTCTPYGVNTHRMLIRGHRIDPSEKQIATVSTGAVRVSTNFVIPILTAVILAAAVILILMQDRANRKRKQILRELEKQDPEQDI